MAVTSRTTTLTINSATGNRTFVASVPTQDVPANSSVTVTVTQTTGGTTPPPVPNTLTLRMQIGEVGTDIISYTLTPGSASQTATFVLTHNGASGGDPRSGTVTMRLEAVRTSGGAIDNYNANSNDTGAQVLPAGWSVSVRNQGWLRGTTMASITVNNTSPGDWPFTGTYAYADTINVTATLAAAAYNTSHTLTLTTGVQSRAHQPISYGSNEYSAPFVNGVTVANYGAASTSRTATITEAENNPLTGQPFVAFTSILTQTIAVDPRLTLSALTRLSPLAKVNFGLHPVSVSFRLLNARLEPLSAAHGSMATLTVRSRDVATNVNQGTASTALDPVADTYTVTWTYAGPTSTANRGTGPNGDTAAHDLVGRAKTLTMWPNNDAGNTLVGSTIVSLSDLLQLDSHPQKTDTLVRDTDPLATPGDKEATAFIISADVMSLYAYAADVNGAPIANVNMHRVIYDPKSTNTGQLTNFPTAADGWITTPLNQNVVAPAGVWKTVVKVDVTHPGSFGNYGITPAGHPTEEAGSLVQFVTFGSAYTANREPWLQLSDEVVLNLAQPITAGYHSIDVESVVTDLLPDDAAMFLDIFSYDASGVKISEPGYPAAMTRVGSTKTFATTWAPQVAKTYIIELKFQYGGAGVLLTTQSTVRPRIIVGIY